MRAPTVLAILGVVLAAALGFAAHVVAQDTVGLPAVELEGGRPLAPAEAEREDRDEPATTADVRTDTGPDDDAPADDDNSGPGSDNSGSGSDDSGSGSDDSGSGSDDSGSGSDSSGSGSDDSGGQGRGRGRGRGGDDD